MKNAFYLDRNAYMFFKTETPSYNVKLDLKGKVVVITGASSGIGLAVSETLYTQNAIVIMIVRNLKKAQNCVESMRQKHKSSTGTFFIFESDLSSYSSIIKVVFQILKGCKKIDLLINNAGIGALKERIITVREGSELVMASNYFGHFLLTLNLLPLLRYCNGKVISISSFIYNMYELDDDFCQRDKKYNGWKAYSTSKACQIIMTKKLSQIIPESECCFIAVSPGIVDTPISETFSSNLIGKSLNILIKPIKKFFCKKMLLSPKEASKQILSLAFLAPRKSFNGVYVSQNRIIQTNFNDKLETKVWLESFYELLMNVHIEARRFRRGPMNNEEALIFIKRHPEIYLAYIEIDDLNLWERSVILPNEKDLSRWNMERKNIIVDKNISNKKINLFTEESILNSNKIFWKKDSKYDSFNNKTHISPDNKRRCDYIKNNNSIVNENVLLKSCCEVSNSRGEEDITIGNENVSINKEKENDKIGTINNISNSKDPTKSLDYDRNKKDKKERRKEIKNKRFFLNSSKLFGNTDSLNKSNTDKKKNNKERSFMQRIIGTKKTQKKANNCDIDFDVVRSADDCISDVPFLDEHMFYKECNENNFLPKNGSIKFNNSKIKTINNKGGKIENCLDKDITKIIDNNESNKEKEGRNSFNKVCKHSPCSKMVSEKSKCLNNYTKSVNLGRNKTHKYGGSLKEYNNNVYNKNVIINNSNQTTNKEKPYLKDIYTQEMFDKFFIINERDKLYDVIESTLESITMEDITDYLNMKDILLKNGYRYQYNFPSLSSSNSENKTNEILSMSLKDYCALEIIQNNWHEHPFNKNNLNRESESYFDNFETSSTSSSEAELIIFVNSDDEEGINLGPSESIPPCGIEYLYEDNNCGTCYVTKTKHEDAIYKVKYDMKLSITYKIVEKASINKSSHLDESSFHTSSDESYGHEITKLSEEKDTLISSKDVVWKAFKLEDCDSTTSSSSEESFNREKKKFIKMIKKRNF
uniref:Short-chain dehydrogenase n=1 Tax=Parastrongyloides trichosuri TaxID=131310 RepID=A0A0N5A3Z7_PARTI